MDQKSEDSPENPTADNPPGLDAVEVLMSDEEVNIFPRENRCMAPAHPPPPEPHRFGLPSMNDESRFGRNSTAETEASMDECECYPELQEQPQHVPLPELSTPRFVESSYALPEIPIERPHCPVPNNQMFMPPHIFNPEIFPDPPHTSYNYSANVQHDQNSERPSPDSSSMPENRRLFNPMPNPHLHFGLTHTYQPSAGNPPVPPRLFNTNEPGPSHCRKTPVPGGLSRSPPLPPLSVNIPGTIELTCRQMSNLRGELRRVSTIFSRLATVVQRKSCAPLPRTTRNRRNPFARTTGTPSSMGSPNAGVSNFGPTKAKQLKTKQTVAKSSKSKVPNAEQPTRNQTAPGQPTAGQPTAGQPAAGQPAAGQPAAAQPIIGLLTIAPPTVAPTPGRPANLTLAILKPSMLCYDGRKNAIIQTDPLRYNSFAGMFRSQSSTDSDDQQDENGNGTSPKRNLKRRHSDTDS